MLVAATRDRAVEVAKHYNSRASACHFHHVQPSLLAGLRPSARRTAVLHAAALPTLLSTALSLDLCGRRMHLGEATEGYSTHQNRDSPAQGTSGRGTAYVHMHEAMLHLQACRANTAPPPSLAAVVGAAL